MAAVVARADELLEVDTTDAPHLFWVEIKRIFFAMREIELEDVNEVTMGEFVGAGAKSLTSSTRSRKSAGSVSV